MDKHTPAPWDPYAKTSVRFVELSIDDYRHAVRCVNAHDDLIEGLATYQRKAHKELDRLRETVAGRDETIERMIAAWPADRELPAGLMEKRVEMDDDSARRRVTGVATSAHIPKRKAR